MQAQQAEFNGFNFNNGLLSANKRRTFFNIVFGVAQVKHKINSSQQIFI